MIRQIILLFDESYKTHTEIGMGTKGQLYCLMKFHEAGNLKKYLIAHEKVAQEYEEVGGLIMEDDHILNLHSSLPFIDTVVS